MRPHTRLVYLCKKAGKGDLYIVSRFVTGEGRPLLRLAIQTCLTRTPRLGYKRRRGSVPLYSTPSCFVTGVSNVATVYPSKLVPLARLDEDVEGAVGPVSVSLHCTLMFFSRSFPNVVTYNLENRTHTNA